MVEVFFNNHHHHHHSVSVRFLTEINPTREIIRFLSKSYTTAVPNKIILLVIRSQLNDDLIQRVVPYQRLHVCVCLCGFFSVLATLLSFIDSRGRFPGYTICSQTNVEELNSQVLSVLYKRLYIHVYVYVCSEVIVPCTWVAFEADKPVTRFSDRLGDTYHGSLLLECIGPNSKNCCHA